MERAELAARLVAADAAKQKKLLREHSALLDENLAYCLKDICLDGWSSEPAQSIAAASLLSRLAAQAVDPQIEALAIWAAGLVALINGRMEEAINCLNEARAGFLGLQKTHIAAATQVSKLIALAMLGRYDEAIECGLQAREVFLSYDDLLAVGKVETNIGNIYFRRDRYHEAEQFQRAAREHFLALNNKPLLTQATNCLANTHALLHRFRSAEKLYAEALQSAEDANLTVTQAEIEGNLGNMALFQGRYDVALDFLERSRRKYAALEMPHQSLIAEQEIADAYLELNLVPEAVEIYERIAPRLADFALRGEQARVHAQHGRALIQLSQTTAALQLLAQARELYEAEKNAVGAAAVRFTAAWLQFNQGDYAAAGQSAAKAETVFLAAGTWRRALLARWLRGETARLAQDSAAARRLLESALREAELQEQPQVAFRCHTSLGLLVAAEGHLKLAENSFLRAVELIEKLRAPLPAEEFRAAFFADNLTPYHELARLCLRGGRTLQAFHYVENARARALAEQMTAPRPAPAPADEFTARAHSRLEELREELNWFYSRINRPGAADAAQLAAFQQEARERERETLDISRQLQHQSQADNLNADKLDFAALQNALGPSAALVEYILQDGHWRAFVVTDEGVEIVAGLGSAQAAQEALTQFTFQLGALRHGPGRMRRHLPQLAERARRHLAVLYDLLLRPLEEKIGSRRLVIVPHGALHYVPFHALHDGATYVIEQREVSYAPSAAIYSRCAARPVRPLNKALLCGVPDELAPRMGEEAQALAPLFAHSAVLLGQTATRSAVRDQAAQADLLHFACHGQFRPDNPLFSALKLADGWFTVRDAAALCLQAELVTLSACETGINAVAPGDEIIGLARGFFAAGVPSLVLSLWTVDDEATAELMTVFYRHLQSGFTPAAALRSAQCAALAQHPHPFFWSPFILLGR